MNWIAGGKPEDDVMTTEQFQLLGYTPDETNCTVLYAVVVMVDPQLLAMVYVPAAPPWRTRAHDTRTVTARSMKRACCHHSTGNGSAQEQLYRIRSILQKSLSRNQMLMVEFGQGHLN